MYVDCMYAFVCYTDTYSFRSFLNVHTFVCRQPDSEFEKGTRECK